MHDPVEQLMDACRDLLRARAEGEQAAIAHAILDGYQRLRTDERVRLLRHLAREMDPDPEEVAQALRAWSREQSPVALRALLAAAEPSRRKLFRRLHQTTEATQALVRVREDLLAARDDVPELDGVDLDLRHLLRQWFTRSFLELTRIDWSTSAEVLERIATNEAVHEVSGWLDLRARVRPSDRRCYGFFHPAMPGEPLIFVMVALTTGPPTTITEVLETRRTPLPADEATTAVFYSISDCQPGLRGISFGNALIKTVVDRLSADLPSLASFVTLSPVTGLTAWASDPPADPTEAAQLAARYLLTARRADGRPLDPVARFHLRNGASLDRILPGADPSPTGMARAHGVMCSYRYEVTSVAGHIDDYAREGTVPHSAAVAALLPA